MDQSIVLDNIKFNLTVKQTARNTFKIQLKDGQNLIVTTNKNLCDEFIIENIKSVKDKILSRYYTIKKNYDEFYFEQCLLDQKIWLYGVVYEIIFTDEVRLYEIDEESLTVRVNQELKKDKQYLKIIRKNETETIDEMFYKALSVFKTDKQNITLKYKNYLSRWGACFFNKGQIILNNRLVHLPKPLIEAIIWHELVHLNHPNHGQNFYRELIEYLPQYHRLKKNLRRYSIFLNRNY